MSSRNKPVARRRFLRLGATMLAGASLMENLGCSGNANTPATNASSGGAGANGSTSSGMGGQGGASTASGPAGTGGQGGAQPMVCTPSDSNILGPYYRPNAPFRNDLADAATEGVRVEVSGCLLYTSPSPRD